MIVHVVENQIKTGYKIFLWASLPCTPTSSQYVNEKWSEEMRRNIMLERLLSVRIMQVLNSVIAKLQKMTDIELAF
eukprot:14835753-Heterocapsa_arctica.AAC.1